MVKNTSQTILHCNNSKENPANLKALRVRSDTDIQEVITRDNVELPFFVVFLDTMHVSTIIYI